MPPRLPDPTVRYPLCLPDGTPYKGTVLLKNAMDHPRMEVGDYTYASDFDPPEDWAAHLAPYLFPFGQERLVIGKFCQIAHGVRFITSGANHAHKGPSTFPFPAFDETTRTGYQPDRRDTLIGHDVWFGFNALICPGARIGNGAIIGAGSVVRGDIPAYAVVTGNPAQITSKRFDPETITRLEALEWWHWPAPLIQKATSALETGDTDMLEALQP